MWIPVIIAFVLTATAGYVDAVGYLTFARIYTANMSGNSVAVGIGAGQGNWAFFAERLWPVVIYVGGILLGRVLLEVGGRVRFVRVASVGLLLEIALLSVAVTAHPSQQIGVALLALAMGLQNALLTRFSPLTVHTGFVTGSLVGMCEEAVRAAAWVWDAPSRSAALARLWSSKSGRRAALLLVSWCCYVAGATAGAFAASCERLLALAWALPALAALVLVDLQSPLAVADERAQLGSTPIPSSRA